MRGAAGEGASLLYIKSGVDEHAHYAYNTDRGGMMTFREIEKMLLADGWRRVDVRGSHFQYKHTTKPGKVTIPNHKGDLNKRTAKSILKQAGIEEGERI